MTFDLSTNYNVSTTMPKADHTKSTLWKKTQTDVTVDGKDYARDVGTVRNGYSRLNMISSLSEGDKEDWYTFNVVSKGELRFSIKSYGEDTKVSDQTDDLDGIDASLNDAQEEADALRAKNMKVEIYTEDKRGNLVLYASNDEKSDTYEQFESLIKGEAEVDKQTRMYVKLSRLDEKDTSATENYTIQIQMGDSYKHDYVTVESAIKKDDYLTEGEIAVQNVTSTASSAVLAGQGAANLLSAGASNLKSIGSSKASASSLFSLLV